MNHIFQPSSCHVTTRFREIYYGTERKIILGKHIQRHECKPLLLNDDFCAHQAQNNLSFAELVLRPDNATFVTMSFASLLSKITKDKKLEEKAKLSGLSNTSKASSSLTKGSDSAKPTQPLQKKQQTKAKLQVPLQRHSYVEDDDPAVRRLKEARRKERERLQELKDLKAGSSSKKKTAPRSASTPASLSKPRAQKSTSSSPHSRKTPQNASASPPLPGATKSRFKNKPYLKTPQNIVPVPSNGPAAPKLSFKELMKQAESIDKPAVASLPFKAAAKPQTKEPSKAYQSLQKSRSRENEASHSALSSRRNGSRPPAIPPPKLAEKPNIPTGPRGRTFQTEKDLPSKLQNRQPSLAKPSPELLRKLKKRQSQLQSNFRRGPYSANQRGPLPDKPKDAYDIDASDEEDYDEYGYGYGYNDYEDDGFIVNDEEEEDGYDNDAEYRRRRRREKERQMESQGYNKDEIWEIFNRGRKRSYYDRDGYDTDDMEATGTEILEDEERTLRQAKLDDLKEQKLLEKKAAEKRKLLRR